MSKCLFFIIFISFRLWLLAPCIVIIANCFTPMSFYGNIFTMVTSLLGIQSSGIVSFKAISLPNFGETKQRSLLYRQFKESLWTLKKKRKVKEHSGLQHGEPLYISFLTTGCPVWMVLPHFLPLHLPPPAENEAPPVFLKPIAWDERETFSSQLFTCRMFDSSFSQCQSSLFQLLLEKAVSHYQTISHLLQPRPLHELAPTRQPKIR